MDIRVDTTPLSRSRAEAVVVFATKGRDARPLVRQAGAALLRQFDVVSRREAWAGSAGQVLVLHDRPGARVETLVLAGLGDAARAGADALRAATGDGVRAARDAGAKRVAVLLPEGRGSAFAPGAAAETVTEGVRLGLYVFEAYKSEKSK